jgi:hypothetical protein
MRFWHKFIIAALPMHLYQLPFAHLIGTLRLEERRGWHPVVQPVERADTVFLWLCAFCQIIILQSHFVLYHNSTRTIPTSPMTCEKLKDSTILLAAI